jgi:peptidoglycan hydrolase CwlO-like protein
MNKIDELRRRIEATQQDIARTKAHLQNMEELVAEYECQIDMLEKFPCYLRP